MSVHAQAGIDVSKERLDVSIDGAKPFRAPNTPEGVGQVAGRLPAGATVHLESSGGCERLARRLLAERGFEVRTHDPLKVRRYAQAKGRRGKTDALDAKNLSSCGGELKAQAPKSRERERLADLSRAVEAVKSACGEMKMQAGSPGLDPLAKRMLLRAAAALDKQVASMQREFESLVEASSLAGRYKLALSVPGCGPCCARVLVSELPDELDAHTDEQLCSYAGVAPIDDQSGKSNKPARIQRGNRRLKAALYMPALHCVGHQDWAKDHYARLRARGRTHQQAAVAIMHRLLRRILAVLKRGTPWEKRSTMS